MAAKNKAGISVFQKYLTVWVILCMVVGVLTGRFLPQIPAFLNQFEYARVSIPIPTPDIAISMGCNVGCPFIGRPFDDNWGLDDPTGKSDEEFKRVIEEIRKNVLALKQQLM